MASFKSIKISEIRIGERARPVDEDHAIAIAASMAERGLINPITVRATPAAGKGKTPWTLVAGGHRLRGGELNQWSEIDAIIVEADAIEAQLIEISENLYRNDLNPLDRAVFVLKFRELFEEKHGKIERGRYAAEKGHDAPFIFAPGRELSKRVQERLGIGPDTYKRATRIGLNLHPTLRQAVRGTPAENDQSKLLKLAKLSADDQVKISAALREDGDLTTALSWLKPPKPEVDPQEAIFQRVAKLLERADPATLRRVLVHIGDLDDFSDLEAA